MRNDSNVIGIRAKTDQGIEIFTVSVHRQSDAVRLARIIAAPLKQGLTGTPMVVGLEVINRNDKVVYQAGEPFQW